MAAAASWRRERLLHPQWLEMTNDDIEAFMRFDSAAFVCMPLSTRRSLDPKVTEKLIKKGDLALRLAELEQALSAVTDWSAVPIEEAFGKLAADAGMEKPFAWFPPARWAVSGLGGGPDLMPMLQVMGRDRVLARIRLAAERVTVA